MRKVFRIFVLGLLGLTLLCLPVHAVQLINEGLPQQFVPSEKQPEALTDADWQPFTARAPADNGTVIFKHTVTVDLGQKSHLQNPLAIAVRLYGVYDFYWDDEFIGSNRHLGDKASLFSRVIIPIRSLTPGKHEIRMRITALGMKKGEGLNMWVAPAAVASSFFGVHHTVISTFFVATASFLVGIYLFVMWYTGQRRPGLVAAITISFAVFLMILLWESKHLFGYPYRWQPPIELLLKPIALLIFSLLAWITLTRLKYQRRLFWMAMVPVTIAVSFIEIGTLEQDLKAFSLLLTALLGLCAHSWRTGRPSAKLYFIGFAFAFTALWVDPFGKHFFLIVITSLLAVDLGLDIRLRAEEAQKHAIVTERLRADLIKRNIQPHFLMNSLTALMEWVETEPSLAVDFIDGLAEEFRVLANFSERDSVTISEELALCNIHIKLMAQRLSANISLETSNLDPEAMIPPGIFHTLIENAFSHNNYSCMDACFRLDYSHGGDKQRYCLVTPLSRTNNIALGTGTGTRYVQARLEEFCGNAFSFRSEQVGSVWKTTIELG